MNRKPGDWDCRWCRHLNFSRRESCFRCGKARSGGEYAGFGGGGSSFGFGAAGADVRPGDWYCSCCGCHNFASRSSCFKCGAVKEEAVPSAAATGGGGGLDTDGARPRGFVLGVGGGRASWKSGDWICSRCYKLLVDCDLAIVLSAFT
ncbi:hypothetical protein Cni_G02637 [Canna indica]|uniref:RanBP2-type domain-containing protein n=1 Tax=Canna indica TaxID=4628 RepID=A0AAQ3JQ22_9LILI|nr:hypothetical protein Cni_G02637 [Canna indica]